MKTSILLDHEPVADGGFLVRALLRLEGDAPPASERVPLNLSLVLDRSGSMTGEPIEAAREAASTLVRRMRLEDTVSVVAYDDDVVVVAEPATGEAQEDLPDRIGRIQPRGYTNLSGGWLRGTELVAANQREEGVNRVILLTDGLANQGITNPTKLVRLARQARRRGISTTTIGFGPQFDEDLLRDMADAGQGGAYYIERSDQATDIFNEELQGLLSLAAQNIRIQLEPGVDAYSAQVMHDYPSHADGDRLTLEVGDLYSREPRRVLMEFLIGPDAGRSGDAEVATLSVTAQVLTAEGAVELETTRLPITLSPEQGGHVEPEVRREALLLAAAKARDEALEAESEGDYERGKDVLRRAMTRLNDEGGEDALLGEEHDDLARMRDRFDAGHLSMSDVKYMKARSYMSMRSRNALREKSRRED